MPNNFRKFANNNKSNLRKNIKNLCQNIVEVSLKIVFQ